MSKITTVQALEILDSRGNPTVRVQVVPRRRHGRASSVPSGASTGEHEAVELRDGDNARYGGKGVRKAVANVVQTIGPEVIGREPTRQAEIDYAMLSLDGSPNKAKLGANAILGVSMAVARAAAQSAKLPLYAYLGGVGATPTAGSDDEHRQWRQARRQLGRPPGIHGDAVWRAGFAEALRYGAEMFHALAKAAQEQGLCDPVGDEGGFAPNLASNEEACELIVKAIEAAGYKPGKDIAIALDPAASSFFASGAYDLAKSKGGRKTSEEMIALYGESINTFPIVSIEDGLDETDLAGFARPTQAQGERIQIVGDDIFVTNPEFIAPRREGKSGERGADQTQPDRHRRRDNSGDRALPQGGLELRRLASVGRDGRRLPRRFHGRDGRWADQDRLRQPKRTHREVRPTARNRGGT